MIRAGISWKTARSRYRRALRSWLFRLEPAQGLVLGAELAVERAERLHLGVELRDSFHPLPEGGDLAIDVRTGAQKRCDQAEEARLEPAHIVLARRENQQGDQRDGKRADGDEVQARFHVTG
jgi:hypothetical protein